MDRFKRALSELFGHINKSSLKGFTLTEVLVVLAILAIVVVLVLPVITTRAQNKSFALAYDTEVKELLNSMETLVVNENEKVFEDTMMSITVQKDSTQEQISNDLSTNAVSTSEQYLKKYTRVSKFCATTSSGCFASLYFRYNGRQRNDFSLKDVVEGNSTYSIQGAEQRYDGMSCALLKNGMSICISPQVIDTDGTLLRPIRGFIDLNGPKEPNVLGRDLRSFSMDLATRVIRTEGPVEVVTVDDTPAKTCEEIYKDNELQDNGNVTDCCNSLKGTHGNDNKYLEACCDKKSPDEACCKYFKNNLGSDAIPETCKDKTPCEKYAENQSDETLKQACCDNTDDPYWDTHSHEDTCDSDGGEEDVCTADNWRDECCSTEDYDTELWVTNCCSKNDYVNEKECCKANEDGKNYNGENNAECCLEDSDQPEINRSSWCCYNKRWGNYCCNAVGEDDRKNVNKKDKSGKNWQNHCCSQETYADESYCCRDKDGTNGKGDKSEACCLIDNPTSKFCCEKKYNSLSEIAQNACCEQHPEIAQCPQKDCSDEDFFDDNKNSCCFKPEYINDQRCCKDGKNKNGTGDYTKTCCAAAKDSTTVKEQCCMHGLKEYCDSGNDCSSFTYPADKDGIEKNNCCAQEPHVNQKYCCLKPYGKYNGKRGDGKEDTNLCCDAPIQLNLDHFIRQNVIDAKEGQQGTLGTTIANEYLNPLCNNNDDDRNRNLPGGMSYDMSPAKSTADCELIAMTNIRNYVYFTLKATQPVKNDVTVKVHYGVFIRNQGSPECKKFTPSFQNDDCSLNIQTEIPCEGFSKTAELTIKKGNKEATFSSSGEAFYLNSYHITKVEVDDPDAVGLCPGYTTAYAPTTGCNCGGKDGEFDCSFAIPTKGADGKYTYTEGWTEHSCCMRLEHQNEPYCCNGSKNALGYYTAECCVFADKYDPVVDPDDEREDGLSTLNQCCELALDAKDFVPTNNYLEGCCRATKDMESADEECCKYRVGEDGNGGTEGGIKDKNNPCCAFHPELDICKTNCEKNPNSKECCDAANNPLSEDYEYWTDKDWAGTCCKMTDDSGKYIYANANFKNGSLELPKACCEQWTSRGTNTFMYGSNDTTQACGMSDKECINTNFSSKFYDVCSATGCSADTFSCGCCNDYKNNPTKYGDNYTSFITKCCAEDCAAFYPDEDVCCENKTINSYDDVCCNNPVFYDETPACDPCYTNWQQPACCLKGITDTNHHYCCSIPEINSIFPTICNAAGVNIYYITGYVYYEFVEQFYIPTTNPHNPELHTRPITSSGHRAVTIKDNISVPNVKPTDTYAEHLLESWIKQEICNSNSGLRLYRDSIPDKEGTYCRYAIQRINIVGPY